MGSTARSVRSFNRSSRGKRWYVSQLLSPFFLPLSCDALAPSCDVKRRCVRQAMPLMVASQSWCCRNLLCRRHRSSQFGDVTSRQLCRAQSLHSPPSLSSAPPPNAMPPSFGIFGRYTIRAPCPLSSSHCAHTPCLLLRPNAPPSLVDFRRYAIPALRLSSRICAATIMLNLHPRMPWLHP